MAKGAGRIARTWKTARRRLVLGVVLSVLVVVSAWSAVRAGGKTASLAMNMSGVSYWNQEWMFVDLLKRCHDWSGTPGTKYRVDKNGWINWLAPGEKGVAMVGDPDPSFPRNFPLGRYVLLYEGEGQLSLECVRCREVSRKPGRMVWDITDSNYVQLVISAVNPANYLRNIRLVPSEFEATYLTHPFHPKFTDALRPFAGIRYYGTQKTTGSLQTHWSDRTKPTDIFQDADGGVALEYLVQLANETATDPWFCIPPRADDDYIHNFARTVFSRLDPDRKVYVEYGNEIWNTSYPYNVDGEWMTQQARKRKTPLSPGDDGSDMTYRLRYQVYRSREIFDIFRQEMNALHVDQKRFVRVLSSQSSYFDRIRFTLDYKFPDGTLGYQHADALAVAPYFGGLWTDKESALAENSWSVNDILDYLDCSVSDPDNARAVCPRIPHESVVAAIRADKELARSRHLRLLGYEGGQHMVAWNGHPAFIQKLAMVNRSPRMKEIYTKYLETWRLNGGELMFLLNFVQAYGKSGYWGALERQDQPIGEAPKFDAAIRFIAARPRWWNDPTEHRNPLNRGGAAGSVTGSAGTSGAASVGGSAGPSGPGGASGAKKSSAK
jgi:hypothetical protein